MRLSWSKTPSRSGDRWRIRLQTSSTVKRHLRTALLLINHLGGQAFVADNGVVRRITPAGEVTSFAGAPRLRGSTDGTGAQARFHNPMGVAVDGSGNLLVADTYSDITRKIAPSGVVTTVVGVDSWPGWGNSATSTKARRRGGGRHPRKLT